MDNSLTNKNETNDEIEILKKKIKKLEDDKHFMMKRIEEIAFYVREHYNINVKNIRETFFRE